MKFYRNTGTVATPTWSEICEIQDLNINDFEMGMAELKRRCKTYTKNLATLIQTITIEFKLWHGLDATNFDALRANFLAGTAEEFAIMNGAIATSGNEGLRIPALIASFPWNQALEEVSGHDVRLVTAYFEEAATEIDPSWYTVP